MFPMGEGFLRAALERHTTTFVFLKLRRFFVSTQAFERSGIGSLIPVSLNPFAMI